MPSKNTDSVISCGRGFTLIETLIATGIMVPALVAVASIFVYSARTNLLTEQRTIAALLGASKIEDLRSVTPIRDLTPGGGLDAANPTADFFEYVAITPSGTITIGATAGSSPYLRLWQVSATDPRLITVAVYAMRSGVTGNRVELFRAATSRTDGF